MTYARTDTAAIPQSAALEPVDSGARRLPELRP
jgi:hypothetical protein